MDKKLTENTPSKEELEEYYDFIKKSAIEGSYFKDALNWYLFRYVNPICDRTIVAFVAIIAAISLFSLTKIISDAFPLVEKVPIIIHAKDQTTYTPFIKSLRDSKTAQENFTIDNAIAQYLLSVYVADREGYDYRKSNVGEVNQKFTRIKNASSSNEYKNFQLFMSKDNSDSPINNFGRNIYRNIQVRSINFIKRPQQDYYLKIKDFFSGSLPNEAEVKFTAITHVFDENNNEKIEKANYLVKIKFDFSGAKRDSASGVLNFVVTNYKLYKIK